MSQPYVAAARAIWALWGVSWAFAGLWAGKRVATALAASYRWQLGIAFVGFGLLFFPSWPSRPLWAAGPLLGWTCVAAVAASCLFAWWARIHLGTLWSAGVTRREGHRVVDSGPYGWVRHPIYSALIVGAAGLALVEATLPACVGAGLIAFGFALKARVEERFLAVELGAAIYADYRRRVPMLLPFRRPMR